MRLADRKRGRRWAGKQHKQRNKRRGKRAKDDKGYSVREKTKQKKEGLGTLNNN